MSSGRSEARLARIASSRAGVFDRAVAHHCGLTDTQIRHRVRVGLWVEMLPGVYRHTATPMAPETIRRAALEWAGPDAVLSHRSAGAVLGLDGIREGRPEILVPTTQHPRSKLVVVHRADELDPHDIVHVSKLRCTSPTRTLLDLAGPLDDESLEFALESARRRFRIPIPAIRARLEDRAGRGHAGVGRLRELLVVLDGQAPAESVLEVRVARRLRRTAISEPVRQFRVRVFGRRYRLDFAWPAERVAVECDGRKFHEFQRDRTKWRQLSAAGWRVLPVTWQDERRNWPAVLSELASALRKVA